MAEKKRLMGRLITIPTVGPLVTREVPWDYEPTLAEMQEVVGGLIEVVSVRFRQMPHQMIVNEEGLILMLPVNLRATSLYHASSLERGIIPDAFVCGTVLLLDGVNLR